MSDYLLRPRHHRTPDGGRLLIRWMNPHWRWDIYDPAGRWVAAGNAHTPDDALHDGHTARNEETAA